MSKLEELAHWLEAGAPHIIFDMNQSMEVIEEDPDQERFPLYCGTMCCIAGYACILDDIRATPWPNTRDHALRILGLPDDGSFYGHPLFNPELAPEDCTPQQAAVAVRKVIADPECNPWGPPTTLTAHCVTTFGSSLSMRLHEALIHIRTNGPKDPSVGICAAIEDYSLDRKMLNRHFKNWPHFTGDTAYPVPHPTLDPRLGYRLSSVDEKWSPNHPYGATRLDLLDHLIRETSDGDPAVGS